MDLHPPRHLLEITIISAEDLPPVSKMLRTFAVAYVDPENKLTTRIDHKGHTNPTWNYKIAFHVDENFLTNDSMAITFDIYNLAWLRDLPIGTTSLSRGALSPPLDKNPSYCHVSLPIRRPSGHLQGTLNLEIHLPDMPETCPSPEKTISERDNEECEIWEQEKNPSSKGSLSLCPTPDSRITVRPESEAGRTTVVSSGFMKPLPSEVVEEMKMWNEYGSSIFEGWTDVGDNENFLVRSTKVKGPPSVVADDDDGSSIQSEEKHERRKKKGGLFLCFMCGFQISIICGSKEARKKRRRRRDVGNQNIDLMGYPHQNLRGFYEN